LTARDKLSFQIKTPIARALDQMRSETRTERCRKESVRHDDARDDRLVVDVESDAAQRKTSSRE